MSNDEKLGILFLVKIFDIFKNNKNDAKILLFTSTDVDGLEILLSAASM